jgi:hypothetical protein
MQGKGWAMKKRYARSTPNISYKINSRGPTCLLACRDTRLALMVGRALEDQHYPLVLIPSALGFQHPLMTPPDIVILDEPMAEELEAVGNREAMQIISQKTTLLLGALPSLSMEGSWLRPHAVLPVTASSAEIVQTIQTLAYAESADGRPSPTPIAGSSFVPSAPSTAVS